MVRRIIGARVADPTTAEDLVQETLVRVLAATDRIGPGMLEPYTIVTARNVVASMWKEQDRHRRNQHRVVDLRPVETPDEPLLEHEQHSALAQAVTRPSDRERELLLAHEVLGQGTSELAADYHSSAGAIAARLNRPLLERGQPRDDEVRIPIHGDGDIVTARQAAREMAQKVGFSRTDLTLIATAVSEVTRNIVRFAGSGELAVERIDNPRT